MKLEIVKFKETSNSIISQLFVDDLFECYILELPYRDNKKNISCIPEGFYHWVTRHTKDSKYPYKHIHIKDVPDRSFILVHIGNYPKDTKGCLCTGMSYGNDVVWNSEEAFNKLMSKISEEGTIIVNR